MLTKLAFTSFIVALGYLYWKRSRQPIAVVSTEEIKAKSNIRLASYALIAFMLLATGSFLYLEWRDQYRVVEVAVINTNTGEKIAYRARRGDVDGRVFETLDGLVVRLADVERLELGDVEGLH